MRYPWVVAALAISATLPGTAQAREPVVMIAIPATTLVEALTMLSAQTGASFGFDGPIPPIVVRGVHGRMSACDALTRLLRGTAVRATRIGPMTFRLSMGHSAIAHRPKAEPDAQRPLPDIIITARKIPEILSRSPLPVSVVVPDQSLPDGGLAGQREVARAVDGLTVAGSGPGVDRTFLRGLADSPFNGFSQATVAVEVDEGRVTYDAAEPGLRLVDVTRVELLKGPQGPLYGTGAIGGVYRIVTNRPVLGTAAGRARISFEAIANGEPGIAGDAMVNLPFGSGKAALRAVGYMSITGGWIDDRPAPDNANSVKMAGGRLSLRVAPAKSWVVDLTGAVQRIEARDSQYVYRVGEDLARPASILEPRASSFELAQLRIEGPIGAVQFVAATSQSWQDQSNLYNLSMVPNVLAIPGATAYRDGRSYRVFDQELRLASAPGAVVSWTAGLSYLSASTMARGDVLTASSGPVHYFLLHRQIAETAVFADGTLPLVGRLSLAGGFRLFRSSIDDERDEPTRPVTSARVLTGFTPNLSLSYDLGPRGIVYARFATAFRPGGIDPGNGITGRYDADEVRDIDLGSRLTFDRDRLSIEASFYLARWHDMQSDYLQPNGLLATRNAGQADVTGTEIGLAWRPSRRWNVEAGITAQRARLSKAADGSDLPADRRLPLVPDLAFRARLSRSFSIGRSEMRPYAAISFTGARRLSFDDGLDRRMSGFTVVRSGVQINLPAVALRLDIDNLLDLRADTFAYGNPFSVRALPQYTPLQPRTVSLALTHNF